MIECDPVGQQLWDALLCKLPYAFLLCFFSPLLILATAKHGFVGMFSTFGLNMAVFFGSLFSVLIIILASG